MFIKPMFIKSIFLAIPKSVLISMVFLVTGCGSGGDGGNQNPDSNNKSAPPSNTAQFEYTCDLNGVDGILTMTVEAVQSSGIVFGPGPSPDITAVIGTGDVTYFTSGDMISSVERYVFTGENQFADFTEISSSESFRVRWNIDGDMLVMEINPFSPVGPSFQFCQLNSARYI